MFEKLDSEGINNMFMEIYKKQLSKHYRVEKESLKETINTLDTFLLEKYKEVAPTEYITHYCLKKFLKKLSGLALLPSEEDYIALHEKMNFLI